MSVKNLVRVLIVTTFLAATAFIHPSVPFLLMVPSLALGVVWWSGVLRND